MEFPLLQFQEIGGRCILSEEDFRKLKKEYLNLTNVVEDDDSSMNSSNIENSMLVMAMVHDSGDEEGDNSSDML